MFIAYVFFKLCFQTTIFIVFIYVKIFQSYTNLELTQKHLKILLLHSMYTLQRKYIFLYILKIRFRFVAIVKIF